MSLFFDLGGVCLSNGWDHDQRRAVTDQFGFDYDAFDQRHRQVVDTLERGQLSLEEYLQWTVFYEPRTFSIEALTQAILELSTPMPDTLKLMATLNNESRELNEYRINHFDLRSCFSAFFTSCSTSSTTGAPCKLRMEVAKILGMRTVLFTDAAQLEHDLRGAGVQW